MSSAERPRVPQLQRVVNLPRQRKEFPLAPTSGTGVIAGDSSGGGAWRGAGGGARDEYLANNNRTTLRPVPVRGLFFIHVKTRTGAAGQHAQDHTRIQYHRKSRRVSTV